MDQRISGIAEQSPCAVDAEYRQRSPNTSIEEKPNDCCLGHNSGKPECAVQIHCLHSTCTHRPDGLSVAVSSMRTAVLRSFLFAALLPSVRRCGDERALRLCARPCGPHAVAKATEGPPGGSGLMGVASECPTARIAKAAPKDRLRKHNDLENMRVDSFCCEIGHFTARVTLNAHFV